jgi:hypothetical protein
VYEVEVSVTSALCLLETSWMARVDVAAGVARVSCECELAFAWVIEVGRLGDKVTPLDLGVRSVEKEAGIRGCGLTGYSSGNEL